MNSEKHTGASGGAHGHLGAINSFQHKIGASKLSSELASAQDTISSQCRFDLDVCLAQVQLMGWLPV
jgi:hypothetical protein